jgi:hypothetical protein
MPTKVFYLPIYKTGQLVTYNNKEYMISGVYISHDQILVKLDALSELVNTNFLSGVELTRFEI